MKDTAVQAKTPEPAPQKVAPALRPGASLQSRIHPFLQLQRAVGNQALQHFVQANLTISQPGDPDEEEADRVADQVMSGAPIGTVQRKCLACAAGETPCPKCEEEETVHLKEKAGQVTKATPPLHSQIASFRGGGQPLPPPVRAFFEPRFGRDFSKVRVHTGSSAAESASAIQARAFTSGQDIVFGAREFDPQNREGQKLLSHELVHVVQQGATSILPEHVHRQPSTKNPSATPPAPTTATDKDGTGAPKIVKPPDPNGELVVHTSTNVTFTDNPEYVRYQLELFLTEKGMARLGVFESKDDLYRFGSGLGPFLDPAPKPLTPERQAYLGRVIGVVRQEVKSIRFWVDDFQKEFERRAVDTVWNVLNKSQTEVEKERDRYGIKLEAKTFLGIRYGTRSTIADTKDTGDLVTAAKALLTKQQTVMSAWNELQSLPADPALLDPCHDGICTPPKRNPVLRAKEAAVRAKLDAAEQEYNILRNEQEGHHPILVTYRLEAFSPDTSGILTKLASGTSESRAEELGTEIKKKLENIETVRTNVTDNRELVWKLPYIVESTRQLPDIKGYKHLSPALSGLVISEKVGQVKANEEILTMALGTVGIGLALLAAVPTGGLSVAAATGVAAAGTAEGVLGVGLAIRAYQKYEFESAATGTSFDKAKAISQEDPSLFWLALDILGGVLGAKGAIESFHRLAQLRRMAVAARTAGRALEATALLEKLEQEGNALKEGAGIGKRLRQETESLASSVTQDVQEIQQNARKIRPSTVKDYVEEIPLGENQFWRRRADGIWCRFASPPRCLIPPSRVPVEVPTATGGAAAEVARIASAGYQKLPNGFKALDAISGGSMEIITEEGSVITQYTRTKGISIKYTRISDATKLRAKVGTDLRELFEFSDYTLESVRVKGLASRQLQLIFEEGMINDLNKQTVQMLSELAADARERMKIGFEWFVTSGGRQIPGGKFFAEQEKMLKSL